MRKLAWAGLAAAIVCTPAAAFGQACLGMPTGPGQFAVGAEFQAPEGASTFLGTFNANLSAPLAFRAAAGITTIDDVDENGTNLEAQAAYRLIDNSRISVCPSVAVRYLTVSAEEDGVEGSINQTLVPVGLAFGTTLPAGSLGLSLYAFPHYLYARFEIEASEGGASVSFSDSSNEFGADIGARIGTSRLFAGASVNFTSIEESDPVFSLGIGIGFGGSRR